MVRPTWLTQRVDRPRAAALLGLPPDAQPRPGTPAARILLGRTPADEFWLFDSTPHAGPDHCPSQGLAVLRHGKLVAHLVLHIGPAAAPGASDPAPDDDPPP
ncbi:MAG: hypothetical protein LW650_11210 [Planctomycetaceae bacterium]|jgi:hypothetical protein|nr:hypothetical protein [Phycisphaerales bacterium]MCE2654008.1 hypothetical protein [Planctomycetaceae bacterium]